jgi:hypothetical protein
VISKSVTALNIIESPLCKYANGYFAIISSYHRGY